MDDAPLIALPHARIGADAGPARVLLVAADPLARAGLAALLAEQDAYVVAGSTAPDDDLADALDTFEPDAVLWDAGLGDAPPPDLDLLREEGLPTVVLVSGAESAPAFWGAGASALLTREASGEAVAAALGAALEGLAVLDPAFVHTVPARSAPIPQEPLAPLTPREQDVLALLAEGLPNKLIADRLAISENTVKFHLGSILGKLDAHSRTEAVVQAARLGLLII